MELSIFLSGLTPSFLANLNMTSIPQVYVIGSVYLALLFIGAFVDIVLFVRFLILPPAWDGMAARIRSRPWLTKDALWIFFILIFIQVGAGLIHWGGVKLGWFADDVKNTSAALVQGVLFHGAALLIIQRLIRRRGSSWSGAFGMNRPGLKQAVGQGLASYIGVLPVVFITSLLYQLLLYAAGYPVTLQDVVTVFLEPQSGWSLFFLLLLAVVW